MATTSRTQTDARTCEGGDKVYRAAVGVAPDIAVGTACILHVLSPEEQVADDQGKGDGDTDFADKCPAAFGPRRLWHAGVLAFFSGDQLALKLYRVGCGVGWGFGQGST